MKSPLLRQLSSIPTSTLGRHIANMAQKTSFHQFKPLDSKCSQTFYYHADHVAKEKGQVVDLSKYAGKTVLVVNTATACGFTPQFGGLEALYKKIRAAHGDRFEILGFPCNQFGGQEPLSDEGIAEFCQVNYGVSFPILKKIDVNGPQADPLFEWMKAQKPFLMGLERIKWNFEKFLIGTDGRVVERWASPWAPEKLESAILAELKKAPTPTNTTTEPTPTTKADL